MRDKIGIPRLFLLLAIHVSFKSLPGPTVIFKKAEENTRHPPILPRIGKCTLSRKILAPGWAGPLQPSFPRSWRDAVNTRDRWSWRGPSSSGSGCGCPPLWGKNHLGKILTKGIKKNPCRQSWEFYLCVFLPTEKEPCHHAGRNMDFGIKPGSGNWLHYFCVGKRPQAHSLRSQWTSVASHIIGAKQHLSRGVELDRSHSMQRMQSKA